MFVHNVNLIFRELYFYVLFFYIGVVFQHKERAISAAHQFYCLVTVTVDKPCITNMDSLWMGPASPTGNIWAMMVF